MYKFLNNNNKLIVSHIADIDGMGSVILAKYFFEDIDFILVDNNEVSMFLEEDLSNYEEIFVCDVSYGQNGINYLLQHEEIASKIKHFDHHESELENNKYPFYNEVIEFDGRLTCATEIFYRYLLTIDEDKKIDNSYFAEFVEAVRNEDTWDFNRTGDTLGVDLATLHALLGSISYINVILSFKVKEHFEIEDNYLTMIESEKRKKDSYVLKCNDICVKTKLNQYKVAVSISESYRSYVGNYLCANNDVDFAVIINFMRNRVSLRSNKDGIDLGAIAREFTPNGGGHKKAAAFNIDEYSIETVKLLVAQYLNNVK